jgi:signal recognition particle receptor subunit beta
MSDPPIDRAVVPVIVVLGSTGAGKSFFINRAIEDVDVKIEDSLESSKSNLMWLHTRTANNPLKRQIALPPSQLRLMGTKSLYLTLLA